MTYAAQIQEFGQHLKSVVTPRTADFCVSFLRELGAKECLSPTDIPSFYYDLLIKLEIMYAPHENEKRAALYRANNDVKAAKQSIMYQFIKDNF